MLINSRRLTALQGRSAGKNATESNRVQSMVMVERTALTEVSIESCQWTSKPLQKPNLARRL